MHIEASLKNNIEEHTVPADYTMCGPVQLQQDAVDFLGACRHSNNTAEISAIGHALALARTRYQKRPVTICYDSEYAASVARGRMDVTHKMRTWQKKRIQKFLTKKKTDCHARTPLTTTSHHQPIHDHTINEVTFQDIQTPMTPLAVPSQIKLPLGSNTRWGFALTPERGG